MFKAIYRYIKIYKRYIINSMMLFMAHRFNLLMSIVANLIWSIAQIVSLEFLYENISGLEDWSKAEMFLLMALGQVNFYFFNILYIHNLRDLSKKILKGEVDILLTKPINIIFHLALHRLNISQIFSFFVSVVPFFYLSIPALQGIRLVVYLQGFIICVLGLIIYFFFFLWVAGLSFFIDNFAEVWKLLTRLFDFGRIPLDILPGFLRFIITFVVPIAFISYFPVMIFKSRINFLFLLFMEVILFIVNFLLVQIVWRLGLKRYSGVN